jgi:hypothetical protein
MIIQYRLPTIEPKADVRIRDIKKGANHLVYVVLILLEGAGGTFGTDKVQDVSRQCVNPPHPFPRSVESYQLFQKGNMGASSSI